METNTSAYPLRLTGELSQRLSRGLWLVKWLLAIPHFVVLLFLWVAFVGVSVVALFAIPLHRPLDGVGCARDPVSLAANGSQKAWS
ncbi:MAG TPA: hypothetical protein VK510_18030, partial [Solirubrobacteraceae bacterium]|nr:hypothetical protein [Solirubrobacteraceae bacterium]